MRKLLIDARKKLGLTHEEAAKICNISRSYYTHIENGTKTPTVKVAKRIGEEFKIDWTYFFKEKCSLEEQSA